MEISVVPSVIGARLEINSREVTANDTFYVPIDESSGVIEIQVTSLDQSSSEQYSIAYFKLDRNRVSVSNANELTACVEQCTAE